MQRFLQNSLLVIISTTVTLLVLELVIRVFFPQNLIKLDLGEGVWQEDSLFGWKAVPNTDKYFTIGEGKVRMLTNEYGRRVTEDRQYDTCEKKFLVLGDSFMEAFATDADSITATRITRYLSNKTNSCIGYDNYSVAAYNPAHYYVTAKHALEQRDYEFGLVFIYTGNDFIYPLDTNFSSDDVKLVNDELKLPSSISFAAMKEAWLYPSHEWLRKRSHLYVLFREKLKVVLLKSGLYPHEFPQPLLNSFSDDKAWDEVARYCFKIQELFDRHNTAVRFFLVPHLFQVNDEERELYAKNFHVDGGDVNIELPYKRLQEELDKYGLEVVDGLTDFREAEGEGSQYSKVDRHFNSRGHETMAKVVTEFLDKHYLNMPDKAKFSSR